MNDFLVVQTFEVTVREVVVHIGANKIGWRVRVYHKLEGGSTEERNHTKMAKYSLLYSDEKLEVIAFLTLAFFNPLDMVIEEDAPFEG